MNRIFLLSTIILLGLQQLAPAALEVSTDKKAISFGLMYLGDDKELAQYGGYHNEITCSSTNGNTWYLKISLLKPLSSVQDSIPLEYFKWQLAASDGKSTPITQYQYREFSLFPELVYISSPEENSGTPVHLQFKYRLEIPEAQTAGSYQTVIRFTITEVL